MIFKVSGITFRSQNPLKIVSKPKCVQKRPQDAPKTHQDAPKTAPRWSKTLLRRLSDEKCDKDGHQEVQDRIQDGFWSQLGAKMAPVTPEKHKKTIGFYSILLNSEGFA